jgi:hypothetical protein
MELLEVETKLAAGRMLEVLTASANKGISTLNGWLMAATGAGFALIVSALDELLKRIPLSDMKLTMSLALWSLGVGIVARWLTTMVEAGLAGGADSRAYFASLDERKVEVDRVMLLEEFYKGLSPMKRWLMRRLGKKMVEGDLVASSRRLARLSQFSAWVVMVQSALILWAGGVIVVSLLPLMP